MDYRDLYVRMTGDERNAYLPREDDVEGHMYSNETMQRAVEALSDMEDDEQIRYAISSMIEHGPRRGATMGMQYPMTMQAGENAARGLIDEYVSSPTRSEQISNAARGVLAPFDPRLAPATRLGVARGLLRYMMERE
jgi:hypothetical protein